MVCQVIVPKLVWNYSLDLSLIAGYFNREPLYQWTIYSLYVLSALHRSHETVHCQKRHYIYLHLTWNFMLNIFILRRLWRIRYLLQWHEIPSDVFIWLSAMHGKAGDLCNGTKLRFEIILLLTILDEAGNCASGLNLQVMRLPFFSFFQRYRVLQAILPMASNYTFHLTDFDAQGIRWLLQWQKPTNCMLCI